MKQNLFGISVVRPAVISILLFLAALSFAQELQPIVLPPPQKTGGMPLMEALSKRQTLRSISDKPLPPQMLSNLLWAAFGVNRENGPRGQAGRTAPSAMNMQEIDVYVAMPKGVYLYEAVPHKLIPVTPKDVRSTASRRPEMAKAPVILIYVADMDKRPAPRNQGQPPGPSPSGTPQPPAGLQPSGTTQTLSAPPAPPQPPPAPSPSFGEVDAGFIGQNVYLFCASEGLATCFHGTDKEGLTQTLKLRGAQKVLYAQSLGYPAENK